MSIEHVSKIVDTRLGAHSNAHINYVATEGAQNVVYSPLTSSSHSNSSTNFNLNNIAEFTGRDSRLNVSITVSLTMNLTNSTGAAINAVQADNFGLKTYPYNRCISSLTHKINQATENYSNNLILDAISKLKSDTENCDFYENTQQDLTDTYSAPTGTKSYYPSGTRSTIRRARSGGCVAPKKKGAIQNTSLSNGQVCGWGSIVRQNY